MLSGVFIGNRFAYVKLIAFDVVVILGQSRESIDISRFHHTRV